MILISKIHLVKADKIRKKIITKNDSMSFKMKIENIFWFF